MLWLTPPSLVLLSLTLPPLVLQLLMRLPLKRWGWRGEAEEARLERWRQGGDIVTHAPSLVLLWLMAPSLELLPLMLLLLVLLSHILLSLM
jgi:hypothetical protein